MEDDPFQDLVRRIEDLTVGLSRKYVWGIRDQRWIEAGIEKDDARLWAASVYHVLEGCESALKGLVDVFRETDPQRSIFRIFHTTAFINDIPVFIIQNATDFALPVMEKYFLGDPEDEDTLIDRLFIACREIGGEAASQDDPLQDLADQTKDLINEIHQKFVTDNWVNRWIEAGAEEKEAEQWVAAIFYVLEACEVILLNLIDNIQETDPHRSALDIYHWMAFVGDLPVFTIEYNTGYVLPIMEKYVPPDPEDEDDE